MPTPRKAKPLVAKPPVQPKLVEATFPPKFMPFITEKKRWKVVFGGRGAGKLLALDCPLATPSGWTTMGDVQVGDEVFDEAGNPTRVIFKSDIQFDKTYRITFSDGTNIVAGASHQWMTWTHADRKSLLRSPYDSHHRFPDNWPEWRRLSNTGRGDRSRYTETGPRIRTTEEILHTFTYGKRDDLNHCIPNCSPLQCSDEVLPIPPYTLGLWLGDGTCRNGGITAHEDDMPFVRAEIEQEGYLTTDSLDPQRFGVLKLPLRVNNLIQNKHVPSIYLRASYEQRLALLQGLMDSDGGIDRVGSSVSFCNTEKRLADAVYELVISLGMHARRTSRIPGGHRVNGGPYARAHYVSFAATCPVFRLPRKAERLASAYPRFTANHRMIIDIEEIAPVPMQCISVDSPNSMYLCGEAMIPTHNTESIAKALLLMGKQRPLRVLCAREIMQSIKQSVHAVLQTMIGVLGMDSYYSIERDKIYGPMLTVKDYATGTIKQKRTEFFFIGLRDLNVSQIKSYFDIQICWVEEASSISKRSLQILAPTIRRAQGSDPDDPCEIWLSFNPEHDHDAVMSLINSPPEDSIIIPMNYEDNPWFDQSGLRPMMEEMKRKNFDEYLHVWEGQCLKYWEGQVFLNELKQADAEKRITDVPYRADAPCEVVFDIAGGHDATALWIYQPVGDMIHLIDYHEKVQSNLDYFLKWIEDKPYVISKYWLPKDAKQLHAGMQHSYESLVRQRGKKVQIVPGAGGVGSVSESINALRTLFPRIRIDKHKCARGIECLRNYRFEVEEDKGVFKSKPVHDQYSHGVDSLRYGIMAYRAEKETKVPAGKYANSAPFRGESNGWMSL